MMRYLTRRVVRRLLAAAAYRGEIADTGRDSMAEDGFGDFDFAPFTEDIDPPLRRSRREGGRSDRKRKAETRTRGKGEPEKPKRRMLPPGLSWSDVAPLPPEARALPVADVAAALLLVRGLRGRNPQQLMRTLLRPQPIIALRASVTGFEKQVLRLLQNGAVLARKIDCVDVFERPLHVLNTIAGRHEGSGLRIVQYTGRALRSQDKASSEKLLRQQLGIVLDEHWPVLVVTEQGVPLPVAFEAALDLDLCCGGLDWALIGEVTEVRTGIPAEDVVRAGAAMDVDLNHLGLHDLALAIRTGRSIDDILESLSRLALENGKAESDETGGKDGKSGRSSTSRSTTARRGGDQGSGSTRIDPQPIAEPETDGTKAGSQEARDSGKKGGPSSVSSSKFMPLTVETLSGYGPARDWALDLKLDLDLWRSRDLDWSGLSSRLLLSGPPGTGKTTFARALCNTLQVPLLVSSVATWLQPGYLGDVLRRMQAVFDEAMAARPSILFIDEIDGIGRRQDTSREHADYWNSLVNKLLELLDGAVRSEGVIVVGATNRPDDIDEAIRRSGRLETHVVIPKPDTDALAGIISHHLGGDLARVLETAPRQDPPREASIGNDRGRLSDIHADTPGRIMSVPPGQGRAASDASLSDAGKQDRSGRRAP